jgi:hypothetical protein
MGRIPWAEEASGAWDGNPLRGAWVVRAASREEVAAEEDQQGEG